MKKFLLIAFGVVLISGFSVSKAQAFTLNDLMSQIASLRAEVGQLKGSLKAGALDSTGSTSNDTKESTPTPVYTPPVPVVPTPVYTPTPTPVYTPPTPTQTEESRVAGTGFWILSPDGDCILVQVKHPNAVRCMGQQSFAKTDTLTTSKNLSVGLKNDVDVLNLQVALKSKGYLAGLADGSYGQGTKTAVMNLQKAKGLPVNGIADSKTIAAINAKDGTPTVSVNSGTVSTDKFIANLPKIIAHYQSILQNPEAFKATVTPVAIQQTTAGSAGRAPATVNHNNCFTYSGGYGSYIIVCE